MTRKRHKKSEPVRGEVFELGKRGHGGRSIFIDRLGERLRVVAQVAACCIIALALARTLFANVQILLYPYEANFGEGGLLYDAIRLSQGRSIYASVASNDWFSPYPPFYAFLSSFGVRWGFLWMRGISLLSHVASAVVIVALLRRAGTPWLWALAGASFWFANPFTRTFAAMGRVDSLGRALESVTLLLGLTSMSRPAMLFSAAFVSALAMLTKQTMFAGALPLVACLWFIRRPASIKFAIEWLGATVLLYGTTFLIFGKHFITNVFFDVSRTLHASDLWPWLVGFLLCNTFGLLASIFAFKKVRAGTTNFVFLCTVLAGLPSVVLAAHDGADVNYFFDLTWGLSGMVGLGLASLESSPRVSAQLWLLSVIVGIGLTEFLIPPRYPLPREREKARQVAELLSHSSKPVLSEFIGYSLLVGSEPPCVPYLDKKLVEAGKRSCEPLVSRIRSKEFGAILITSQAGGRWPREVLEAMNGAYEEDVLFEKMFASEGEPDFLILKPRR
jgi:hypothetical protein